MEGVLLNLDTITVKGSNGIIFQNLSFRVGSGEHWAVIGKSGSGKTALLHTIAGRINSSSGSINYNFLKYFNDPGSNNSLRFQDFVAMVDAKHHFKSLSNTKDLYYQQRFNSSDSEDALTVRQYLEAVKTNPFTEKRWNIENSTTLLRLTGLLSQQIIKLSNGETKRLLIAAALLKNPVLLLMDNPLTGLDIETRGEFDNVINQIALSKTGIIITTAPDEIPAAITHVAIIKDGGMIKQVSKRTLTPFIEKEQQNHIPNELLKELLVPHDYSAKYHRIVGMTEVTVKYQEKTVLDKVSWQILPGERWALLGPNGAGKSTLLSLINGDNPQAYANNIILFDKKRGTGESIWDIKNKIGFVSPELYQYFPNDSSCLQVVESGFYDTLGLFRPSSQTKANIALKWMKALEIDKYSRTLTKNIPASTQRLSLLARALVKTPPLLIFDEPCQGLDEEQQLHFKNILDTICRLSDVTLIYVTHYRHEIPESVTRVLKLDAGRVVAD